MLTTVSAAKITASWALFFAIYKDFADAARVAYASGASPFSGFGSAFSAITMLNSSPSSCKNCCLRGEAEARISFELLLNSSDIN